MGSEVSTQHSRVGLGVLVGWALSGWLVWTAPSWLWGFPWRWVTVLTAPLVGGLLLGRLPWPARWTRWLAVGLGGLALGLGWAAAERLARAETEDAEWALKRGELAFLAAVAAAPPSHADGTWTLLEWPSPGGELEPATFAWWAEPGRRARAALADDGCADGFQRASVGVAEARLPRRTVSDRLPPLGPAGVGLVVLGCLVALLGARRGALARMVVSMGLVGGLAWVRAPTILDDPSRMLSEAASGLVFTREVDARTLTPCPAPPEVRFTAESATQVVADARGYDARIRLIFFEFLGGALAMGALLGLLIHGVERSGWRGRPEAPAAS